MRIEEDPKLSNTQEWEQNRYQLDKLLRNIAQQLNLFTEGRISAVHNAEETAPTSGQHAKGDIIRNDNPSELTGTASGSSGAVGGKASVHIKYVVSGFICTSAGATGKWKEIRVITGF